MKKQVLDETIRERVLMTAADKAHLVDERRSACCFAIQLACSSLKMPDGSFDVDTQGALSAQGIA